MNYHNITKDDMLNGEGIRVVLWVSGCSHRCNGCHNPITWNTRGGLLFDEKAEAELFEALGKDYIDGITFSGGDPLHLGNREEVLRLVKKFKTLFPQKNIWLYTGFSWEEVRDLECVKLLDVIAEGKFVKKLFDPSLQWVGSSNQRVIDVQKSLTGEVVVI